MLHQLRDQCLWKPAAEMWLAFSGHRQASDMPFWTEPTTLPTQKASFVCPACSPHFVTRSTHDAHSTFAEDTGITDLFLHEWSGSWPRRKVSRFFRGFRAGSFLLLTKNEKKNDRWIKLIVHITLIRSCYFLTTSLVFLFYRTLYGIFSCLPWCIIRCWCLHISFISLF